MKSKTNIATAVLRDATSFLKRSNTAGVTFDLPH
jgi:hypothetical protein